MTPTPQEPVQLQPLLDPANDIMPAPALVSDGERVIISGVSGLYPSSHHIKDLSDILYNKVNPVTKDGVRWSTNHPEAAQHVGIIPDVDRFDAQFFKVHYRLGNSMDPMSRKLLEQAYNAIYDAGVNPERLSGRKVGVFIGSCLSEAEKTLFYNLKSSSMGLGIAGCCKAMFANRISYWLNVKGPSMTIDESCCSSLAALEQAYQAIIRGECEAAIVGGCSLSLQPQASVHYGRIISMAMDGKTKSFDQNADGYAKTEAINVIFLQKAKDALRIYADLMHTKTEYIGLLTRETGPQYGYFRNPEKTADFLKKFYEEVRVPPYAVEYVEAFGSGTPDADKTELDVIERVFCKDKEDTLLVGSVMSNIGYGEAASGITAITKVLLGYHRGEIAANLHCSSPRQDVAALREGRMRVVTEHQPFRRSYVAVNSMSVTGVNSHVLLHGHYKPKNLSRYNSSIAHLVTISARQDTLIEKIFENLKSRPIDPEELALLHNIHETSISGHLGRGFIILKTDEEQKTVSLCEKTDYFDDARRPLWFVYSGMGSQWAGMGAQLMRVPIFAAAIERCRKTLEPKGIDIVHIITSPEKTIFDNILHSFVGIAAIQIGLTDVLKELGLVPDGIIGHSVGELGCAYADGCLTAEEMILSAYSRGLVSLQTPFIRGSMAAIGLGYEQIIKMCPPEIEVACHNGPESSTISGPADIMKEFVAELTAKGIFAKEVPCSNIAYHSRYIADAGPSLLKYLNEVIKTPRARSERWVSTSVPFDRWQEPLAKYSSADYHTNNLLNPVLFEETLKHIPSNAVLVEVAPHGLLQAILKRSLPADCMNIALTRRGHADNTILLLEAVGKLYMQGYNPTVQVLYPKVEMPVSTETPFLSHLVKWAHGENWNVPLYQSANRKFGAACTFIISLHDKEHAHLKGNVIREQTVFPFASTLVAVWDTLAMSMGVPKKELSVEFHDVHLYSQPVMNLQSQLKLRVALQRGTGRFEVYSDRIKVAAGTIKVFKKDDIKVQNLRDQLQLKESQDMILTAEDIYNLLRERDYLYSGEFRSIEAASSSLNKASLVWLDNWVTFIDGLLQLNMLRQPHDGVTLPTFIRRITVDVEKHLITKMYSMNKASYKAEILDEYNFLRCGGLMMDDIRYRKVPASNKKNMELHTLKLVSNFQVDQKGKWGGEYNVPIKEDNNMKVNSNVMLQSAQDGDLNSLEWVAASETSGCGILVKVHYTGLSNTDINKAIGKFTSKRYEGNNYGMDFSGTTESGSRVMGLVRSGAAGSVVRAQPELLWPVPAHWSLEDAATVPLAYAHALYCLGIKYGSRLTPDISVLVHGGAGALGQALLSILLAHGCEVYTTVSDIRKKHFLLELFPDLKANHIGNSRDQSFVDMVRNARKGDGCYIVINSLKTSLKADSVSCVGNLGGFFDVSQLNNQDEDFYYGMNNLTLERSYVTVDFSTIFENSTEIKTLHAMLSEGITRGYVRPLSRVSYAPHDVTRAFQLLAASKHRGRVLLKMDEQMLQAQPRFFCNPDQCQLVVMNDESFGLQLVDKLVACGSRKLQIHSKAHTTGKFQFKLRNWQKIGVKVLISSQDLNKEIDVLEILKHANQLGSIEGIYAVTNAAQMIQETLFYNLDIVSRRICPDLRYFAVINIGQTILGKPTCLSRVQSKLPAKLITLPQQINEWSGGDTMDVVERVLCGVDTLVVAQRTNKPPPDLLEKVAEIAEIKLTKITPKTTTFEDLGIQDNKLQLIASYLRIHYNVEFNEKEIPQLTVQTIMDLNKTENTFENIKGLATFISYVDTDELLATAEIVCMPTITNGNTLREDEFDGSETYLCIVPGMEGHHERFRVLCERLKLPALVLQPGLDRPTETVPETARRFVDVLLNKTGMKNTTFYLLGYEAGVQVALEMAVMLEELGLTGTVYCLGCAPDEVQNVIEENISEYKTKEQLENEVVKHMFKLMVGDDVADLEGALKGVTLWPQKVDVCVQTLLGRVPHSVQYSRSLIEAALARIERARTYVPPTRALCSQLVLLRAASTQVTSTEQALQQYSQRPVAVHQLTAPLAHAVYDTSCASLINEYLDPAILESFEEKNICEAYLLNPLSFVTIQEDD